MDGTGVTALILPLELHEHASPCPACHGRGVTGERYEMTHPPGRVLLADVICPVCGGCGNGDPAHGGCQPEWHADPGEDGDESVCPSCGSGRGWWPVRGFGGDGDDTTMCILRCPCGCSESRLVPVETETT